MNPISDHGLQSEGIFIPLDFYAKGSSLPSMLHNISTELNTPIGIIQSKLQLLKKFCSNTNCSLVNETFSLCEDSIESIQGFFEKINLSGTSGSKHVNLKPAWFSLQSFINPVLAELGQQSLDVSRIKFSYSETDSKLITDKYLFIRILVNLLSNALKFSNREVELIIATSGNRLSIIVRDYGIGIPKNQINEIFNPFVRGSNAKMIKGSGLGLCIVANAVKWLNGHIYLCSEVGKGAEFRITFPYGRCKSDFMHPSKRNKSPDHFEISESEYSQIIGAISHELRTPIAILKSNIQLLRKLNFENDKGFMDESLTICKKSIKEIERFFDKLSLKSIELNSGINNHLPDTGLSKLQVN